MVNFPPSVPRLPPPHHHHRNDGSLMVGMMDPYLNIVPTPMTNKEEGNTEIAGDNCLSVNRSTRIYYVRRCKRKRLTNIESLPDEMVFNILLHLSAQDIYNSARLVCRKWYHMIHSHYFIYAHLQHSTYGLHIKDMWWCRPRTFVALRQGRIEISKLDNKLDNKFKEVGPVWASCNGLILESDFRNLKALHIRNPATNQRLALPLFFHGRLFHYFSGIAYAAASMRYKVVVTYLECNTSVNRCAILTVGVDNSWRHVHTKHLSVKAEGLLFSIPLITEGYIHWVRNDAHHLLTLNVETEVITETPVPRVYGEKIVGYYYLSTGRYLSLVIGRRKFLWEVWELKPETGEWIKLPNFELEVQKCKFEWLEEQFSCDPYHSLIPVGWLKYPEALAFSISYGTRACIACNFHTREIQLVELPSDLNLRFIAHRNSLVFTV